MKTALENHNYNGNATVISTLNSSGYDNKNGIQELREKFKYLTNCFFKDTPPAHLTSQTDILDDYFQNSFAGSSTGVELDLVNNPYAIIARGNYGRKEICCQPDVNILFIFSTTIPEKANGLIQDIIYPLWDLDLNITYSTRTVEECIIEAKENHTYLLSVLDSRFVCGASLLFSQLVNTIREKIVFNRKKEITAWQFEQDKNRHEEFNSREFLLEPDLIFSKGGLKDLHSIISIGKATLNIIELIELKQSEILSESEFTTLENSIEYIRKVVRFLNITNRRSSRLLVKHQFATAKFMKYKNTRTRTCTDLFLSDLYEHMNNVRKIYNQFYLFVSPKSFAITNTENNSPRLLTKWLCAAKGLISFKSTKKITDKPLRLLSIFNESERLELPLNSTALRLVNDYRYLLTNPGIDLKTAGELLEETLFLSQTNSATPFSMLDSGILTTLIPELSYAVNKKTAGYYHFHPFCHHLLLTLSHLKEIFYENKELKPKNVQNNVSIGDLYTIFWAALLHDLEPEVVREILGRFGKPGDFIEDVCFLTINYNLLYGIISRGKIFGDKTIKSYSSKIKSYRQLNRLYFLTIANMKAKGFLVHDEFRMEDLAELYHKIIESRFDKKTPSNNKDVKIENLLQVCRFHKIANPSALISSIDLEKYQGIFSYDELILHLKINAETPPGEITFFSESKEQVRKTIILSKIPICSLLEIMGILLENKLNIYDYRGSSFTKNTAVHAFRVARDKDRIFENEKWTKIKDKLKQTTFEKSKIVGGNESALTNETNYLFNHASTVKITHSNSDKTVIIELISNDCPVTLYKIIKKLLLDDFEIIFFRKTEESQGCLYVFQIIDTAGRLNTVEAKKELSAKLLREATNED